jgi:predicted phosphodiesterase
MEIKLNSQERKLFDISNQTNILALNKLTFLRGNLDNFSISLDVLAETVDNGNIGGTHGHYEKLKLDLPKTINLLEFFNGYGHTHVSLTKLELTNSGNCEVIIDMELLNG